jgi:hypothetical protein
VRRADELFPSRGASKHGFITKISLEKQLGEKLIEGERERGKENDIATGE